MYKISIIRLNNLYVVIKVKHFKFLYDRFKNEVFFIKDQIIQYYNVKRMKGLFFKEKNKAYLFYKNIIIKQPNNKLDFKKFKPFTIVRKILEFNYKLSLPKTI